MVRQARNYFAGAVSGTALISHGRGRLRRAVSLQTMRDWPLCGGRLWRRLGHGGRAPAAPAAAGAGGAGAGRSAGAGTEARGRRAAARGGQSAAGTAGTGLAGVGGRRPDPIGPGGGGGGARSAQAGSRAAPPRGRRLGGGGRRRRRPTAAPGGGGGDGGTSPSGTVDGNGEWRRFRCRQGHRWGARGQRRHHTQRRSRQWPRRPRIDCGPDRRQSRRQDTVGGLLGGGH